MTDIVVVGDAVFVVEKVSPFEYLENIELFTPREADEVTRTELIIFVVQNVVVDS